MDTTYTARGVDRGDGAKGNCRHHSKAKKRTTTLTSWRSFWLQGVQEMPVPGFATAPLVSLSSPLTFGRPSAPLLSLALPHFALQHLQKPLAFAPHLRRR